MLQEPELLVLANVGSMQINSQISRIHCKMFVLISQVITLDIIYHKYENECHVFVNYSGGILIIPNCEVI